VAIHKICGIETEYGIVLRGTEDPNPIAASSVLINAYVAELNRKVGVTSVGSATNEQLERRAKRADEWLRSGR